MLQNRRGQSSGCRAHGGCSASGKAPLSSPSLQTSGTLPMLGSICIFVGVKVLHRQGRACSGNRRSHMEKSTAELWWMRFSKSCCPHSCPHPCARRYLPCNSICTSAPEPALQPHKFSYSMYIQTPEEGEIALRLQAQTESTGRTRADDLRAVMLGDEWGQAAVLQTLLSRLSDQ